MCLNETYSEVHIDNHLSANSPIQNGLKSGDALDPLLFSFVFKYVIKKVQETQMVQKLSGAHQILAYADDVILLVSDIYTIKKNTGTLIGASKEVNAEKTVCCCLITRMHGKILT
jgi:hypothetical protein